MRLAFLTLFITTFLHSSIALRTKGVNMWSVLPSCLWCQLNAKARPIPPKRTKKYRFSFIKLLSTFVPPLQHSVAGPLLNKSVNTLTWRNSELKNSQNG